MLLSQVSAVARKRRPHSMGVARRMLAGIFALGFAGAALADEFDVRFSGFGTLGMAWSSQHRADFVNTVQPYGPGRSRAADVGLDSMLALQADVSLGRQLDGVIQAVSARHADGSFRPQLALANLRYAWSDDLTLRAGRLPPALALAAEYRRVNFALPWARPPVEVYGMFPGEAATGVEALLRTHHVWGMVDWRIGSTVREAKAPLSNNPGLTVTRAHGVFVTADLSRGDWHWSVSLSNSHSSARTRLALDPLLGQIMRIDPALVNDFNDEMNFTYMGLGMLYDGPDWLLMGESISRRGRHTWVADQQGGYLTLGRRLGRTMPYATLARRLTANDSAKYASSPAHSLIGAAYGVQRQNQSSLAFGVRQELSAGVRLKVQLDFIRPDADSRGLYTNHAADFNLARPPLERLFSVGVDFLF